MQNSIIRADEPPKHAGNSVFAAIEFTKPCGFWGRPVQTNLILCAGRGGYLIDSKFATDEARTSLKWKKADVDLP
jgi:hypothetical protein